MIVFGEDVAARASCDPILIVVDPWVVGRCAGTLVVLSCQRLDLGEHQTQEVQLL